jgi:hypothetical protein
MGGVKHQELILNLVQMTAIERQRLGHMEEQNDSLRAVIRKSLGSLRR